MPGLVVELARDAALLLLLRGGHLLEQARADLRVAAALGDVVGDDRIAHEPALAVPDGGGEALRPEAGSRPCGARQPSSTARPSDGRPLEGTRGASLAGFLRRVEAPHVLADDLVRRVALEALGPGIPVLDAAGPVDHVEGVVAHAVDEQAEPALRRLRVMPRPLLGAEEARPADRGRDPVRHELEKAGVLRGEATRGQAADVDDADPAAVEHERGAKQGVEPLGRGGSG